METYDYIILGGGISGLTYGRLLQLYTDKSFLIIEKESQPGGLCRSKTINGNTFDIGGGHFLHSKEKRVYDFIFSHIPESSFNRFIRKTKINLRGTYIDYPIEQNLWQLPESMQFEYLLSLIHADKSDKKPVNFKEWIYKLLGKSIANDYLLPYNNKIWGVDTDTMAVNWLHKLPIVKLETILKSIVYRQSAIDVFPSHEYFYYPKSGGFGIITDAIYKHLEQKVRLNTPIEFLDERKDGWVVNGIFRASRIINTLPWPVLKSIIKVPYVNDLCYNSIVVSIKEREYENDWHWCYIPDKEIAHHREFYVNNYCPGNLTSCISYETNIKRWDFNRTCFAMHSNPFAYPIPTTNYKRAIDYILNYFATRNIFGLGRWGQWEYFNSDVCIGQAINLFNNLEDKSI